MSEREDRMDDAAGMPEPRRFAPPVPPATAARWAAPEAVSVPPPEFAQATAGDHPGMWQGRRMASWGYRFGAELVDWGAALAVSYGVRLLVDLGGDSGAGRTAGLVASIAFWLLNLVVIAGLTHGRTVGKLLAGIRIERENGKRYGFGTAFLRDVLCRLLWVVPFFAPVDVLMATGDRRQTVRDKMVHTRAMRLPQYRRRRWPLIIAALLAAALFAAVSLLDRHDAQPAVPGLQDKPGYTDVEHTRLVHARTNAASTVVRSSAPWQSEIGRGRWRQ